MDNKLMTFENAAFGKIRTLTIDGEPWFVAVDVCRALEIGNPTDAMRRLDADERTLVSIEGASNGLPVNAVNEPGLYTLILGSRKPEAKAFKRWITHEVIPSIRKHGAYMADSLLDALEAHPEAVPEYLNRLRSENARNRELTRRLRLALPKAEYYDAFVDPADCTNIRTTAKELEVPERRFVRFLLERRYVYRTPSGCVLPYAKSANDGLFCVRDYYRNGHTGSYTLVTPKGKALFLSMLGEIA